MTAVVWADDASQELLQILDYVSEQSEPAAHRLSEKIYAAIKLVSTSPKIARPGRVSGTREKLVTGTNYIVAFEEIGPDEGGPGIAILHIIHTSRDWPKGSWPKK